MPLQALFLSLPQQGPKGQLDAAASASLLAGSPGPQEEVFVLRAQGPARGGARVHEGHKALSKEFHVLSCDRGAGPGGAGFPQRLPRPRHGLSVPRAASGSARRGALHGGPRPRLL